MARQEGLIQSQSTVCLAELKSIPSPRPITLKEHFSVCQSISTVLSLDRVLKIFFLLEEGDSPMFKNTFSGDNQAKSLKVIAIRERSDEYWQNNAIFLILK